MSDVSPQIKKPTSPLVVAAVLLVVGVGGYIGYTQYQAQRFSNLMKSADTSYRKGEYAQAIEYSSQAVATASTVRDSRVANSLLARSLLGRDQEDDTLNGVAILKDITASPRTNDRLKAIAYSELSSLYRIGEDNEVLKQFVFDTPPYSAYLVQAKEDVREATLLLLQDLNALYPTPYSNFRLAVILAEQLNEQGLDVGDTRQIEIATVIREHIAAGDRLLAAADTSTMTDVDQMNLHRARSLALGTISLYFTEIETGKIEESYDRTMSLMNTIGMDSTFMPEERLRFLLNYAAILSARPSSMQNDAQNEKIKSLLSTFVQAVKQSPSVDQDVLEMQSRPAKNYMRRQIPVLAEISQEFAGYLKQIGWKS